MDNSKDPNDRPYRVGKGKPPVEHRWPKGKSGNPAGRPRGRRARTTMLRELMVEIANELIEITQNGQTFRITKKEALLMAIMRDALQGTPAQRLRAFEALQRWGAFDVLPGEMSNHEAARKLVERLAEFARREKGDEAA